MLPITADYCCGSLSGPGPIDLQYTNVWEILQWNPTLFGPFYGLRQLQGVDVYTTTLVEQHITCRRRQSEGVHMSPLSTCRLGAAIIHESHDTFLYNVHSLLDKVPIHTKDYQSSVPLWRLTLRKRRKFVVCESDGENLVPGGTIV